MKRESAWWRSSTERYGRYWGQQQRPTVEVGEWEMGMELGIKDEQMKLEYLKITDEVTGLTKVKQVKILGKTIRFEGDFKEFIGTAIQNMISQEKLVEEPEIVVEMTFFVGEIFRIQEEEENQWAIKTGRGSRNKSKDTQSVLLAVIKELDDKGKINKDMAVKMVDCWERRQQNEFLIEENRVLA